MLHAAPLRPRARALALAAALVLAPPAAAELELAFSGGQIGGVLTYALDGDPVEIAVLVPSFTQGPTPLALVSPGDPRVLAVGLDLPGLIVATVLDAGGAGSVVFPIPLQTTLQGVPLHAQAVTVPGSPFLVDDVSNPVGFALAEPDTVHATLQPSVVARQGHTATPLPDGTVLVAGGDEPDASGALTARDSLEVYDPQTQSFTLLPATLTHPRSTHTATALADGRVLLLGGYDETGTVRRTGEVFDPATGTTTPVASMSVPRTQHTATRLADGRVLVVAGSSKFDLSNPPQSVLDSLYEAHRSAEVWDPGADAWTSAPNVPLSGVLPQVGLVAHQASRLGDGRVLVTGGVKIEDFLFAPLPSFQDRCYRYDPPTNAWLATASLPGKRAYHGQITLDDGDALIAGGADGDFVLLNFHALASAARYDTPTNTWSAAPSLAKARAYPNLVRAGDEVLAVGGLSTVDVTTGSGTPERAIEAIPHSLAGWTTLAQMLLPREVARAAAVQGGERVVIVGTGDDGDPATVDRTAEVLVR